MGNFTKEQALSLYETRWWLAKSARDICNLQLFEERLCMPFDEFHKAVEEALGRPVYTHEFGLAWKELQQEFIGTRTSPTFAQIVDLIPEAKRILIIPSSSGNSS